MIFSDEYFERKMSKVNANGGLAGAKSSGGTKPSYKGFYGKNTRTNRNAARRTKVANLMSRTNKK